MALESAALQAQIQSHYSTHLKKLLAQVPDDIHLLCGHNYGSEITTTIADQKKANPFLLIEDEDTFVRYRMHVHDSTRTYPMSPMTLDEVNALL